MKEILGFIAWQWRQWLLYQKLFVAGAFLFGAGIMLPDPYDLHLVTALMFAMLVWLVWLWLVLLWDNVKASWAKYREERNRLFKTIKDSDC